MAKATRKNTSEQAPEEQKFEISAETKRVVEEGDKLRAQLTEGGAEGKKKVAAPVDKEGSATKKAATKKAPTKAAATKSAKKSEGEATKATKITQENELADLQRQGASEATQATPASGVTNDAQNNIDKTV